MSLLVDKQIKKLIDRKEIIIDPYSDKNFGSGSYKLALGGTLLIPEVGQIVDLASNVSPSYQKIEIPEDGYVLKPGAFVLGQTLEKITIPKYMGGLLDSRSTMARIGLSVHNTAMYLEPGHKDSVVTLEMFNEGPFDIVLKKGVRIAKLIFISASDSATRGYWEYGRYASQNEATPPKIDL